MMSAAPWYSTSSSLFWETAVVVVISIATVLITFLAWRSSILKRRLLCNIVSRSQLIVPSQIRNSLDITYEGKPLLDEDPHVVAIEITNIGKSSIPSGSFDNGRSVVFSLNTSIIKVLNVEHEPRSAPSPVMVENDNTLELKPELITRNEKISVSLLTAGDADKINVEFNPMDNVKIETRNADQWLKKRSMIWTFFATGVTTLVLAILALGAITFINNHKTLSGSERQELCETIQNSIADQMTSIEALNSDISSKLPGDKKLESLHFSSSYDSDATGALIESGSIGFEFSMASDLGIKLNKASEFLAATNNVIPALERLEADHPDPQEETDLEEIRTMDANKGTARAVDLSCLP